MTTRNEPKKFNTWVVVVAIAAIIILAAYPLMTVHGTDFGGSDGAGSELIEELAPDYDPTWISNIWEPPGGETESMLFALQAVAGGILIGYLFGYKRAENNLKG